jgi:hypothetical protein
MYQAYVTRIKNLRKHSNADRLLCGECFGNTVIVGLDTQPEQLGIYFPVDGKLSAEYAFANNLVMKKDDAGNNTGGYLDPDKRNIKALKLRGEKSDGLFMPLESLESFGDIKTLKDGDVIGTFNGHEICSKYIPVKNTRTSGSGGNKTRKRKDPIAPLFAEHADTEQLAYNMNAFKPGDEVEITLKMHGTSGRTAYLPVFQRYKRTLWDKLTKKIGKPVYDWGYVSGTRRVVLDSYDGGFYGSNSFREQHSKRFEGKLMKGETVYYEIVGFTDDGTPIMPACSNKKLNDKDFVKQYGEQTVFSYGCYAKGMKETGRPRIVGTVEATIINENGEKFVVTANDTKLYEPAPKSELYVYRMTMTNEDGFVVEYTPDFMRYRCEQMGVNTVPVFYRGFIPEYYQLPDNVGNLTEINAGEFIKGIAEQFYDGADPIGKTHVREGVVCRIINRPKFAAYKHKNFSFKVLEGLIKEVADAPDMEEQQEVVSDDG